VADAAEAAEAAETVRRRKRTNKRVSEATIDKAVATEPTVQGRTANVGEKAVKFAKFASVNTNLKFPTF
jgi:hypothetical protein